MGLNSHKSIRLLKTACVTRNTCLHVPSQNSRTEDFPSLGVSPLLRKSRTPTSLGQSCPSQPRREWATRSSRSTSWATRASPAEERWMDPSKSSILHRNNNAGAMVHGGSKKYFNYLF